MEILTLCLLLAIIVTELWKLYLVFRKWKSFAENPPKVLEPFIKDEDYKRLKVENFVQCASMAAAIVLKLTIKVAKLTLAYNKFVWEVTQEYAQANISRAVWYVALDVLITQCIEKPFELLGLILITPLEHHQIMDHLKSMLTGILTASVLAGVLALCAAFIAERFGAMNLLLPVLIFEFFGLLMVFFCVMVVVPLIARPLSTICATEELILKLAKSVGFPDKRILVDVTVGRPPNTFYLGVLWKHILVINLEMLLKLSPQQAVAQVAHELGHWKYGHSTIKMAVLVGEVMAFSGLTIYVHGRARVDELFGFTPGKEPHPLISSYLAIQYMWPVLLEWLNGPANVLMANCEHQADKWACSKGHAEHLKSGLLVKEGQFRPPQFDNLFSMWFYGVPTVLERVKKIGTYPTSAETPTPGDR